VRLSSGSDSVTQNVDVPHAVCVVAWPRAWLTFCLSMVFLSLCAMPAVATDHERTHALTRWAFDAGFEARLWDLSGYPAEEQEYRKQAGLGSVMGVDISAWPWDAFGFGVVLTRFHSSAQDHDIGFPDGSRGHAEDDYAIHYVAPALYARRSIFTERVELVAHAGVGMMFYRNESPTGQFPGLLEGHTWGAHMGASVDYRFAARWAMGLGMRLHHGTIEDVHYNAMSTTVPGISLTRVGAAVGLRYYP
jgi:hypothetical protein